MMTDPAAATPSATPKPTSQTPTAEEQRSAAARTLPRRSFVDDMPDRGLFAAVVVGGFLVILFLKTRTQISSVMVAGLAIAAMGLYGFAAYRLRSVQLRPDRIGENLYYMGFIFTLASLCAALLQVSDKQPYELLLGNFGIALITTVFGIVGRVVFAQMRGDMDDVQREMQQELVAASDKLRQQLNIALRDFETFHTGVLQATSEAIQKVAAAGTAQVNSAVADSHQQAELLTSMLMRINQSISELPVMGKVELPSERLEKQISALADAVEALIKQLEQVTGLVRRRTGLKRRRWYWLYLR